MRLAIALCAVFVYGEAAAAPADPARVLTRQGLDLYKRGEYAAAVERFNQAYAIAPAPLLLYDVAQAYRLAGDCDRARRYYVEYLMADPVGARAAGVKRRIVDMEACAHATVERAAPTPTPRPAAHVEPPPVVPPTTVPAPAPSASALALPPPPRSHRLRTAGFAVGGGGVALIGTAIYLSTRASSDSSQVAQLYQGGGSWSDHYQAVQSDGRASTSASIALYAVGGAALATGVLLWTLDRRHHEHVVAAVAPGSLFAAWQCDF
jgi:tetratricopeptide (TPR) repeat protein